MKIFDNAKWIWIHNERNPDEYGEFFSEFVSQKKNIRCRISCDGDYAMFINGKFVSSNQYGDFEHYKIYDEFDIGEYVDCGVNQLSIIVWHFGVNSQRYIDSQPGVIFEIVEDNIAILSSDSNILCRKSQAYLNGYCKKITSQLGLSFLYDSTKENTGSLHTSTVVEKNCTFYPRPIERLKLLPAKEAVTLKNSGNYYLIDLLEETVGLPTLELYSDTEQRILVSWGEDLQNGHVRRIIGGRDFSFEYIAKRGYNQYTNYMLRIGCRYMELYSEKPLDLKYLGVIPQIYPVNLKEYSGYDELDRRIYDVCARTLKLSMMEHYVDTPWREQCLYAFDSRNQILCGYKAFEGGNAEYARANLLLMSKDERCDNLMSICYPCGSDLTIPSFSLYYFVAVKEYIENTGDISLGESVYPKLISIISAFVNNMKNGLVCRFKGTNHWNFYDWSKDLDGHLGHSDEDIPDLMINCLFIIALEALRKISMAIGKDFEYSELVESVRAATKNMFFDSESGAYCLTEKGRELTDLGNAFAILSNVADNAKDLCEKIIRGAFTDCTLSMKCFKYDALLMTNKEKYHAYVIEEIRSNYKKMLDAGATSVWETIEGAHAFGNAGSLCHGWSAIPICYL